MEMQSRIARLERDTEAERLRLEGLQVWSGKTVEKQTN